MLLTRQVTKSTRNMPAIHTAVHMYLFPSVTFSLHSWYAHSDELTFLFIKISQETVTYYSFYVLCKRQNTRQAYGLLFTKLKPIQCRPYIIINVKIAIVLNITWRRCKINWQAASFVVCFSYLLIRVEQCCLSGSCGFSYIKLCCNTMVIGRCGGILFYVTVITQY